MKQNNFGRIVNVSSLAGSLALFGQTAAFGAFLSYRSSKTLLNLLTVRCKRSTDTLTHFLLSSLSYELKDFNILVNSTDVCVCVCVCV